MRVGISLLTLVPGISGGSEIYARALARSLARVGTLEYVVLTPSLARDAGGPLDTVVAAGYPSAVGTVGRLRAMGSATLRPGRLLEQLGPIDVLHYPLSVPVPRTAAPDVVTLHDVQHLDLPDLFSRGERAFRRVAYDRAARRASRVIVVSEFAKRRAVDLLGLAESSVDVIPLGVDHELFSPAPEVAREPLLLYPARPWPHKNHARLLVAFEALRRQRPELQLVLTGAGHDTRSLPQGVTAQHVSPDELVALYRRAACLVFPSLYEGFGLPPLEAMACGCPVAASSAGAIPEVCGDAAVLFDPTDPGAIAAGIEETLTRSTDLAERGLRRAREFTWEATAREHDRVYKGAV